MARTSIGSLCLSAAILLTQSAVSLAGSTGTLDRVSGWYAAGTSITVTATAGLYSQFAVWSGDTNGCPAAGGQINVAVDRCRRITASFAARRAPLGTPESWLARHGLTNAALRDAELGDVDGDGARAWQEYIAGTDPTNRHDCLGVGIAYSGGASVISFETRVTTGDHYGVLARFYALEYVPAMTRTNWITIPGLEDLPASGQTIIFTNNMLTNSLFYRARTWLE